MTGALSEGLSILHRDDKHNTKRQQIRSSAKSSGGQLVSGFKGFGHGIVGGLKSLTKPFVGVSQGGLEVSSLKYSFTHTKNPFFPLTSLNIKIRLLQYIHFRSIFNFEYNNTTVFSIVCIHTCSNASVQSM